ncbi:MAG: hypothetical protein GXP31_08265 [Kiritimatiellaeota bacterium]|nr:hypothetical protein [Kiritimatiellota bacterium]
MLSYPRNVRNGLSLLLFSAFFGPWLWAAAPAGAASAKPDSNPAPTVYPVAILPFSQRGAADADLGKQVSELLFAELVSRPELLLVEREELKKVLSETELNLSGLVSPGQATQIGQLTGAKILVTGSVLTIGAKRYLVAKIIGTETSRVLGASVKGLARGDVDDLIQPLAEQVAAVISQRANVLVAKPEKPEDRIAAIREKLGKAARPLLAIIIKERHVGPAVIDPAAQTELTHLALATGFQVIDAVAGNPTQADIVVRGEGISEYALRRGNLISIRARLEVKATDPKTNRVLAVERQTVVAVGVAEQVAAKSALQQAAARIAERLLPKLVRP